MSSGAFAAKWTHLQKAIEKGDIEQVKLITTKKPEQVSILIKKWQTPLHLAASNNQLDIVKYLVEAGADVNSGGSVGTPFMAAAGSGNLELVNWLIKEGADITATKTGETALHFAIKYGNDDIVSLLISMDFDVNALNNNSYSPLHYAIATEQIGVANELIDSGAEVNVLPYVEIENHFVDGGGIFFTARSFNTVAEKYIADDEIEKAIDVTNLGNHRQCKDILDALVTGQRLNRRLVAWRACQRFDLLTIIGQNLIERFELTQQQFQIHLETAGQTINGSRQPEVVDFGPVAFLTGCGFVMQAVAT